MNWNPFKSKNSLSALEARVKVLEDERKQMLLEWDDTFERFRLLYARLSKRVKQMQEGSVADGGPQAGVSEEGQQGTTSSLTPRQQQLQERILARRARMNGGR
jgi:hypothetical protein